MPASGAAFTEFDRVFCRVVNVTVRVLLLFWTKHCLLMCYSSFGPSGVKKTQKKQKQNPAFLLNPKYLINISFCVLCLLFCFFFSSFCSNLLSLACSIKSRLLAHGACATEPGVLYIHPFILFYLFVVNLRFPIYPIHHFCSYSIVVRRHSKAWFSLNVKPGWELQSPGRVFVWLPQNPTLGTQVQWTGEGAHPRGPAIAMRPQWLWPRNPVWPPVWPTACHFLALDLVAGKGWKVD